ncbi:MAG: universal stress protein [Phycisphaerae bacterium]|nr:universal stress protein [Phycisphaerae bacterium]
MIAPWTSRRGLMELHPLSIYLLVVEIAMILLVARLGGIIMRLLGQPEVIGEMLGGLVLGPSVLGLIHHGELLHWLFPDHAMPYLNIISQLGLMFFMFMVGLELDLRTLVKRGGSALGMGLASILIPFAGGIAVAAALVYRGHLDSGHSHIAFILMTAAAIGASAFPVMARIITDQGLTRTSVGQMAIASAAVIDVTGWCLLAVVYDIAQTQVSGHGASIPISVLLGLKTLGLAVAYTIVMMFFVPRFLWKFQAHFESRSQLTRDVLALLLLLLLISSAFTQLLGINLIFGAFMMGAILPSEARFVKHLTEKLEDVTLLLLMPIFFTTIGLRTNIALIDSRNLWQTWAWLLLAMVLLKVIVGTTAAKFAGLSFRESTLMGFLVNCHGVMELIILNLAWQMHAIDAKTMAMLVLALLSATVLSTPFISLLAAPMRRRQLTNTQDDGESAPEMQAGQRILLCLSQTQTAVPLVQIGSLLLGSKPGRVQALQLHSPDSWQILSGSLAQAQRQPLDAAVEEARRLDLKLGTSIFPSRKISRDICRTAAHQQAGWIIMGSHTGIFYGSSLGGVTGQVLAKAPCNVAILVHKFSPRPRHILVPYIGEPQDVGALLAARAMAVSPDVHITILHVVRPGTRTGNAPKPEFSSGVQTLIDKYLPSADSTNQIHMQVLENDSPAQVVVRESHHYDLIILGISPQWQLHQKLLGVSQTSVAQRSACSVLIVQTRPAAAQPPSVSSKSANQPANVPATPVPTQSAT